MVQEEDKYQMMIDYAPAFLDKYKYEQEIGVSLPFVFHGGESVHG